MQDFILLKKIYEMTPEKNKSFVEETRNTEDSVISFRGEGCNIPPVCPGIFVI